MTSEAVKQATFIVCPLCDEKECVGRYDCKQIADYVKSKEQNMATEKRLIDARGKYTLNAGDITGHIMCVENGYATVFDRFAKVVCKFSLLDAPTVDAVEVVHGQWIPTYHTYYNREGASEIADEWHCSECGIYSRSEWNYCPNCGAKMDGDGNG